MQTLLPAKIGSISHGTLRPQDLLSAFINELEWQIRRNGEFFAVPENFPHRDRLNTLIGEAQDCFSDDGESIADDKEDTADELVNETLPDALQEFAPSYCYFGSHPGDGSDIGYWPSYIEDIKEQVEFSSSKSQEYPADDFRGEWLHINERGNCTLYVRQADGSDREVWAIV